ncbi:hypothetical protein WA026_017231 [Henosepilachna vigintioctopunctata]|uniref:Uncharacterized protein n=1 Tax=Henosepilachna vigintioctopunctata TaxID=420089 RepID=A0AAW1UKE9_9CUCU
MIESFRHKGPSVFELNEIPLLTQVQVFLQKENSEKQGNPDAQVMVGRILVGTAVSNDGVLRMTIDGRESHK